jgi:hypothetical protein
LRTKRRRFSKPEPGAIFSVDEVPVVADVPPVVVAQSIATGELRTFKLDGVVLVDAADLCAWIDALDARIAAARGAAA